MDQGGGASNYGSGGRGAQTKGPVTSMSLDASSNPKSSSSAVGMKGSRPRSKVHQALAIAASINGGVDGNMKAEAPQGPTVGARGGRGGVPVSGSGGSGNGANPQAHASSSSAADKDHGGDYESGKCGRGGSGSGGNGKGGSSGSSWEAEEMRQMVADLDRFDANDDNDNLDDSF